MLRCRELDGGHCILGVVPSIRVCLEALPVGEHWVSRRVKRHFMKRFLLLLAVAALSVGCDDRYSLGGTQGLSTEPTMWRGSHGTAVTIRFATGTERLEGAQEVTFRVDQWYPSRKYWWISKFAVPVMKLEPRAVTLFFSEGEEESRWLKSG